MKAESRLHMHNSQPRRAECDHFRQFMEESPLPLLVCEWSIVTKDAEKVDLSSISDYADSKPWRHTPLKE